MNQFFLELHYQDGETTGEYIGYVTSLHFHKETRAADIVDAYGNEDNFSNITDIRYYLTPDYPKLMFHYQEAKVSSSFTSG